MQVAISEHTLSKKTKRTKKKQEQKKRVDDLHELVDLSAVWALQAAREVDKINVTRLLR